METCIICLGDLPDYDPLPTNDGDTSSDHVHLTIEDLADVIIARLPCSHMLHNSCLTMWIARANSCPICRNQFNTVDLTRSWNGPVISSYTVEDRVQAQNVDDADIPPEEEEEEEYDISNIPNCFICDKDENDHLTLMCDQCDGPYHTYCLGMTDVPSEEWYCQFCSAEQASRANPSRPTQAQNRRRRPATKRARREARSNRRRNDWEGAWQNVLRRNVWRGLNSDLNRQTTTTRNSRAEEQDLQRSRELRDWNRRVGVARRQGIHRFEEAVPMFVGTPQTEEEINSWAMFDEAEKLETADTSETTPRKARRTIVKGEDTDDQISEGAPVSTHKRTRSRTGSLVSTSAIESDRKRTRTNQATRASTNDAASSTNSLSSVPERKLKRPMTRRNINIRTKEEPENIPATSLLTTDSLSVHRSSVDDVQRNQSSSSEAASPSLLDSLLEDINKAKPQSTLDRTQIHKFNISALSPGFENSVITPAPSPPRMASPVHLGRSKGAPSPASSSDGETSPRSRRQKSIRQQASLDNIFSHSNDISHTPNYYAASDSEEDNSNDAVPSRSVPLSPELSPELSPYPGLEPASSLLDHRVPIPPAPPPPPPPSRPLQSRIVSSNDQSSPASSRDLDLNTKTDLRNMVKSALQPFYKSGDITKDDYTNINMNISHKLYSKANEVGRIKQWEKMKWQQLANEEVRREVHDLKNNRNNDDTMSG